VLDEAAFQAYSPAFYSAGNLLVYGAFFAFYTFTFVFILLDSWRPIATAYRQMGHAAMLQARRIGRGLKGAMSSLAKGHVKEAGQYLYNMMNDETSVYDGFDDPFTNMMRNYPEVPDWWLVSSSVTSLTQADHSKVFNDSLGGVHLRHYPPHPVSRPQDTWYVLRNEFCTILQLITVFFM